MEAKVLKMKNYAIVMIGLALLNFGRESYAQQRVLLHSQTTNQESQVVWQDLVVPSYTEGLSIDDRSSLHPDWIAADYKNNRDNDTGALYTGKGTSKWPCWVYHIDEDRGGYGYLFDPVMTQDKVFFRYGRVEFDTPDQGYKLLYVEKNSDPSKIHWISPQFLHYNHVEISPSGRYVAYMTGGAYEGLYTVFHDKTVALWVTDTQKNKVAQVAVNDWIMNTDWWDGEKLRFLHLKTQSAPPKATVPSAGIQASVPTREFIESKQFDPATGITQILGRQLHRKDLFYLENDYNAFFGESYTKALPKQYADGPQSLQESVLFDSGHHELIFASRVSFIKQETHPDGQAYYRSTFAIVSMTGSNKFTPLVDFSVRSFQNEPTIKLFRVRERLFMGVTSHSSVPSTYLPQIDLPSHTMTIYEIKNGEAEVARQEENCFGLSQIIDGASVYASY